MEMVGYLHHKLIYPQINCPRYPQNKKQSNLDTTY
jgi:hypothetical protein